MSSKISFSAVFRIAYSTNTPNAAVYSVKKTPVYMRKQPECYKKYLRHTVRHSSRCIKVIDSWSIYEIFNYTLHCFLYRYWNLKCNRLIRKMITNQRNLTWRLLRTRIYARIGFYDLWILFISVTQFESNWERWDINSNKLTFNYTYIILWCLAS